MLALWEVLLGGQAMPTLYVRNIPDDLYQRLQDLAASQHRSISAQVITMIEKALLTEAQQANSGTTKPITEILAQSRHRRRVNPTDFGLPDSTTLIREDRDR